MSLLPTSNKVLWIFALLGMLVARGNAITINYLDQIGSDVMYTAVSEDTRDEPAALYGSPSISGNTLDFDPTSFATTVSSSTGTSASDIVDGQLNFTVMSNNDTFSIPEIIITERGDYTLTGLGNAQATASVAAPVIYSITHVDGTALNDPIDGGDDLVFTPDGGSYALPADVGTDRWTGSLTIDIASIAAANGITGAVTKVEVAMDNVLSVAAFDGGSASIAKKDTGVTITIPEPSGLMLVVPFGLLVVSLIRRSRTRN